MAFFSRFSAIAAGLVLSCAAVSSAQAASAIDYDVVAFGNFTSSNTEVNGALAVGGNATLANFSVGKDLAAGYTGASLAVGQNLTYNNGQVFRGNAVVGGTITASGFNVLNGTKTQNAASPVNFGSELTRLSDLSTFIAGLENNGTVAKPGALRLTGTNSTLNVFTLDAANQNFGSGFELFIPEGSVAVINVTGTSFTTQYPGQFSINGKTIVNNSAGLASSILFNFADATDITLMGSWAGNILAPNASVTAANGGFFGSLIANNVTSSSEFYMGRFSGYDRVTPPAVPEPATWAMMIAGFGLVGSMMRRRNAQAAIA